MWFSMCIGFSFNLCDFVNKLQSDVEGDCMYALLGTLIQSHNEAILAGSY